MSGPLIVCIAFGLLLMMVNFRVKNLARKSLLWVYLWVWVDRMLGDMGHHQSP